MSEIFTNYPQTSEVPFEEVNVSNQKDEVIRKLKKKIKKQKKIIRKLSMQAASDNCDSSKCDAYDEKNSTQDKEKTFFTKVKDKFIEALPSIYRIMAKTVTTVICGWALKCFGKLKAA